MKHQDYKEQLILLLWDELPENEKLRLDEHIAVCADCRNELEVLGRLNKTAAEIIREPDERMLFEARTRLKNALSSQTAPLQQESRPGALQRISEIFSFRKFTYVSAVPFIILGVTIGYLLKNSGTPEIAKVPAQDSGAVEVRQAADKPENKDDGVKIENLQFRDSDASDGEVAFSFDAVKRVEMRGSLNNKTIQNVLARSLLTSRDDGERLRTLNKIAARSLEGQKGGTPDPAIKQALIKAVQFDNNPGVRREALLLLQQYSYDKEIEKALLHVLKNDRNPGLRITAIKALAGGLPKMKDRQPDENLIKTLKEKSLTDGNDYVKISARTVLQEVEQ